MKLKDFIEKLELAVNSKTLYIKGCFGAPMTATNKQRYSTNCEYNRNRAGMINAASSDTFGFDCVCLVKGILWGWNADKKKVYGGATYKSNGVPDCSESQMINSCSKVSSYMKNISVGELLYMPGHVGVYVGNGRVIECTPACKNGAQITNLNRVKWTLHGYLPWVEYEELKIDDPKPGKIPADNKTDIVQMIVKATVNTAGGNLNVRDENGKILGSLKNKTKVSVICKDAMSQIISKTTYVMAKITYGSSVGYVAQKYLKF